MTIVELNDDDVDDTDDVSRAPFINISSVTQTQLAYLQLFCRSAVSVCFQLSNMLVDDQQLLVAE